MGAIKRSFLIAVLCLCLRGMVYAKLNVDILYNFLSQSGHGGKQVYDGSGDQNLTVYQPMVFFDLELNHNTSISGNFLMDVFTGASDRIFDSKTGASGRATPDAQTGASQTTDGTTTGVTTGGTGTTTTTTPPTDTATGASTAAGTGTSPAGTGTATTTPTTTTTSTSGTGATGTGATGTGATGTGTTVTTPTTTTPPTTDTTTGASKTAKSGAVAAASKAPASGATKNAGTTWEQRKAFDLQLSHKMGTWTFIPSAGFSTEQDYRSAHEGLSLLKSFAEDNFTLGAGYFHYDDSVYAFDMEQGQFTNWTPKRTDSLNLSASQILSRRDIVLVGASLTKQEGLLSGGRNTVALAGARVQEVLPDVRNKYTATLRFIHGLNEFLALHLDYRYYNDDWDIAAHTVEPSLAIGFNDEAGLIRLLCRYYTQQQAKYYRDAFSAAQRYMTSDSDLAAFESREAGIQCSYTWEINSWIKALQLGGTFLEYVRSNDLKATLLQLSLTGRF